MDHKPVGYPDLSPYLVVSDPAVTLDFCRAVFDAVQLRVVRREDGTIMHAECRIGDSVVMIGGAEGGAPAMLHLYLPDPDTIFARALDHGAAEIAPMQDHTDGDRRGGFRAPDGTNWYLARQT